MNSIGEKNKGRAGRGRPKGSPNKVQADVKAMIIEAFEKAGGAKYLVQQSEKNPAAFMSLVGKVLPKDIKAELNVKGWADVLIGIGRSHGNGAEVA